VDDSYSGQNKESADQCIICRWQWKVGGWELSVGSAASTQYVDRRRTEVERQFVRGLRSRWTRHWTFVVQFNDSTSEGTGRQRERSVSRLQGV